MKKTLYVVIAAMLLTLGLVIPASAQEGETGLDLLFRRDFGYGAGGDIQGSFSFRVRNAGEFVRVEYYIDDELVQTVTEDDFHWQFNTASYGEGQHTLYAIGYRADGSQARSVPFTRNFLSAEQAGGNMVKIVVPLLVVVGVITVLGIVLPMLFGRKTKFIPGQYGSAGGAICPRCQLPFSRHFFGPNLLVGKLERCPHCGKISIVPAASKSDLQAAEERLTSEGISEIQPPTDEEKLRRSLDDSRFMD